MDPHDVLIAIDALQDSDDPGVLTWAVAVLEAFEGRAPFRSPTRRFRTMDEWYNWATSSIPFVLDGLAIRAVL